MKKRSVGSFSMNFCGGFVNSTIVEAVSPPISSRVNLILIPCNLVINALLNHEPSFPVAGIVAVTVI